jgi:hypothetical protein
VEHALASKTKTALILIALAAAFFAAVVLRHLLW